MKSKICTLFILLITLLFSCTEKDNPTEPVQNEKAEKIYTQIVEPLEDNYNLVMNLLTKMDTIAAMDSVLKVFLQDTSVSWGEVDDQGIAIQYKNGIRGGIFLDPLDSPDSNDNVIQNYELPKYQNVKSDTYTKPGSPKTIFLNPSYWERSKWADLIIQNYNDRLPAAGYEKPVVYKNEEVTIDKFMNLTGYGIIHIYSHGWAWPNRDNIQEVYLLTGEPWSQETYLKYEEDILNGDIPIVKTNDTDFFISPGFIAKHNNFLADTTLIYGGFCYSYLGNWPGTMVNTLNAGGYYGFDWAVWTSKNAKWNLDLIMDLSDTSQHPPITSSNWMNNELPKWFWSHKYDRAVYIKYLGYPELTLIKEEELPNFTHCKVTLTITMDLQLSSGEVTKGSNRSFNVEGDVSQIEEGPEENIYFIDWDEDRSSAYHNGGMEITVNRSTSQIISFSIWNKETDAIGVADYSFEGNEIEAVLSYDEYFSNYSSRTSDENVCSTLTALSYTYDFKNDYPDLTAINYYCDQFSSLTVSFSSGE